MMKNMTKKNSTKDKLQHEKEYVEFLKKRLASKHFKENVSSEEFQLTKKKLDKAKLVLRILEHEKR
jgi:hypothetical protein